MDSSYGFAYFVAKSSKAERVERKCIFANVGGNRNELFQNCTWNRILRIDHVAKDLLDFIIA